jgi:hypothetical protein
MKEVKSNIKESNLVNGLISVGIFVTAFYFVFLRNGGLFGQKNEQKDIGGERTNFDMTPYIGSKKYFGKDGNVEDYVKGFDMPQDINDINWEGKDISIITKPDAPLLFNSVSPKSMVRVWRVGESKLGYSTTKNPTLQTEDYDFVKDKIILSKNTSLKKK